MVAPYVRRTARLADMLRLLAFALGGEPGARLVARLRMAVSARIRLRLMRHTAIAEPPTPSTRGMDDWARRRRQTSGPILVDLETHRVIEMLSIGRPRRWRPGCTTIPGSK